MKKHIALRILFWLLITTNAFARVIEIPDPNLREAVREALQLPDGQPITQKEMQQLITLAAWHKGITDLTGLEDAIYLKRLSLRYNQIKDLAPIANLINLQELMLNRNPISDLTPLANLINLRILRLDGCINIADISPLQNLVNLERLYIQQTPVTDFTPIQHLNLIEFHYDQVCDVHPIPPSVRERIESRSFPSIFQAWDDVVGLDHLTWEQRNVLHDLHWHPGFETIEWDITPTEPTEGLSISLAGNLEHAHEVRQRRLDQNPNMIFLGGFSTHALGDGLLPPDSDFWLRDKNGNIVRKRSGEPLINFLMPEVQDLFVKRIIAFERCGLYDGAMFDGFNHNGTGFVGRYLFPHTDEDIIQAQVNIFHEARKHIRDDFLILFNTNRSKSTYFSEYINGTYMETGTDYMYGYTHAGLTEIERTLLWSEENLRSPQINCLEGWGIPTEPPDSPENRRWMRVFTTMSLTHSNGYVMYNTGRGVIPILGSNHTWEPGHQHLWYSFWDVDLGLPASPKAQQYQNIEGTFIREFTNGWAVYNRSGKEQTITLPRSSTGVFSNKQDITHLLPDLDGEIYLRIGKPFDINTDGVVNVLDLIIVSQAFGSPEGDINGDGETNILDLTLVAQQFNQ